MSLRSVSAAAFLATGLLAASIPAFAQDTRALLDRIERLQRDVDVLQRRLATGGGATAPAPAGAAGAPAVRPTEGFVGQTEQRFSLIEAQGRENTGKLEELQFKLRQVETKLDKLIADVDFRFQQLERGAAAPRGDAGTAAPAPAASAGSASPGAAATGDAGGQRLTIVPSGTSAQALTQRQQQQQAAVAPREPVRLPAGSPEAQYEFAYGLLLQAQRGQSDFGPAEEAMKAFVAQHPTHRLAGNAQYWYGETLYARRDWQGAALGFGEGLKKYPNAEKAPDNMLRLAMALNQLNRKQDACGALAELDRRYPGAPPPVKQSAARERQRIGC
jgi:tol-pal system protein YbgF